MCAASDYRRNMSEQIAIADIVVPEDRRPLDQAKVAEIAESIKAIGLLSPIGVFVDKTKFVLVYGRHRLEACRSLGQDEIAAIYVESGFNSTFEMMEIAENLHRADLTTQERNEHLARWVALLEKRKPLDIGAAAPISKKPGRKPSVAVAEVAKRSGLATKTIKEAVKTASLAPEGRRRCCRAVAQGTPRHRASSQGRTAWSRIEASSHQNGGRSR
jgi:ParB/RepB/Spo0J family partition protein